MSTLPLNNAALPPARAGRQTFAVVGGTSGAGLAFVEAALAAGHEVRVLSRRARPLPEGAVVYPGDARDLDALTALIRGVDAVVIALGAPPSDRSGVRAAGTVAAVRAMRAVGVRRVVALSMQGVGESYARLDWFTRKVVVDLWLRHVGADHAAQESALAASGLDWTVLRPPHLSDGPPSEAWTLFAPDEAPPSMRVSRADVGAALLRCAASDAWLGQAMGVAA